MSTKTILSDLYRHNEWANGQILRLCEGLSDAQLDQPREIGFGSLRGTLFHILAAEEIWLERWEGKPWRPFPFEPHGTSPDQIRQQIQEVARRRAEMIEREQESGWQRQVAFQDSKRIDYTERLHDLLMHVTNHSVHHRAQAIHFLKQFGRSIPVGLDFLVFKLAYFNVKQDDATSAAMRQYGLEVEVAPGLQAPFNRAEIESYFAYHDWANERLLRIAATLDDAALDRDFEMGPGSIRKTFLHLMGVEPYWLKNWAGTPALAQPAAPDTTVEQLKSAWAATAVQRNEFIAQLDEPQATQVVSMLVGGPPLKFRVLDTLIQICVHGTHHRAQLVNMMRHSGVTPPGLDYLGWVRESKQTKLV